MPLDIEVVTPHGVALVRDGLDEIVLRRREERFELGSEVAILPRHGEMLVRVPECDIRLLDGNGWTYVHVAGGYAQVLDDHVVLLTARAELVGSEPAGCPICTRSHQC